MSADLQIASPKERKPHFPALPIPDIATWIWKGPNSAELPGQWVHVGPNLLREIVLAESHAAARAQVLATLNRRRLPPYHMIWARDVIRIRYVPPCSIVRRLEGSVGTVFEWPQDRSQWFFSRFDGTLELVRDEFVEVILRPQGVLRRLLEIDTDLLDRYGEKKRAR